jgi:hypothetical protein
MIWDSIRHSKTYNPDYSFYFGNNEKSVHTGSTLSEFCAAAAEKIVAESKDGRHYTTVTLDSSIGKKGFPITFAARRLDYDACDSIAAGRTSESHGGPRSGNAKWSSNQADITKISDWLKRLIPFVRGRIGKQCCRSRGRFVQQLKIPHVVTPGIAQTRFLILQDV